MNRANIMNEHSKSQPLARESARDNKMSVSAIFALALTLSVLVFSAAGCQRNIVKASTPSLSTPPPPAATPSPTPPSEPQTTTAPPPAPAPEQPPAATEEPAPTRPKPSTPSATGPEKPAETPRPEAPVISPQLTPQAQAAAEQRTNSDIKRAEQNLQIAESKQLDEAQHDLVEKVRDFLAQAHEAIHGEDWVRASNLAEKARVLSDELVKSL
jgi:outer membrane biosynthesis protein TonB